MRNLIRYVNALSLPVLLGCLSTGLFFLEPDPLNGDKPVFLTLLILSVAWIYTSDHLLDGWRGKGNSGIFRHDLHYRHRLIFLLLLTGISVAGIYLVYLYQDALFIKNGLYVGAITVVYLLLKTRNLLRPLAKMLIVSLVTGMVMVLLYHSKNLLSDVLGLDCLVFSLMVFMNQLVLEYYEWQEQTPDEAGRSEDYMILAKRVFWWILILLIIIGIVNLASIPYAITLFTITLGLRFILFKTDWFGIHERFRLWADLIFAFMWPLLKVIQFISEQLLPA